jgi:hypothetical protein
MLKSRLKRFGLGLVLLTSALVASCSSDSDDSKNNFSCKTAKSACAKDPTPTSEQIAQCDKFLADPKCGNLYATALVCLAQNQTCAADGTTDQEKTKAHCKAELDAAEPCFDDMTDGGAKD